MTGPDPTDPTGDVIRQAAHDAVHALLRHPDDEQAASRKLRDVVVWLGARHGSAAIVELAEELAVDLAEAFSALAAVERLDPIAVADSWFHDETLPQVDRDAATPASPPPRPARADDG